MTTKERYEGILSWFRFNMPDADTELIYETPLQLLIAVILSAQCTDKRVNSITPELFKAFPTVTELANADVDQLFPYVKSISYPRNKAKHIIKAAKMIVEDFGGELPSDLEDLLKLPGVGRKTANVILSVLWDKPAIAVDTHVFRVCNRIGLTKNSKTPLNTEKTLVKYIPKEDLKIAHHWLVLHGRYICTAHNPKCNDCNILTFCKTYAERLKK